MRAIRRCEQLRTDTLNAALPAGCGVRVASASIDKLVIKFPTFADIQRQSGLVEVAAQEINVELETICDPPNPDDPNCPADRNPGAGLGGVEGLAASLSALRHEFSDDIRAAYQDAPDLESDIGDGSASDEAAAHSARAAEDASRGEASRRSVRSNLERLIEKALGATRLSLERVHVRLNMRSPHAAAHQQPLGTLVCTYAHPASRLPDCLWVVVVPRHSYGSQGGSVLCSAAGEGGIVRVAR